MKEKSKCQFMKVLKLVKLVEPVKFVSPRASLRGAVRTSRFYKNRANNSNNCTQFRILQYYFVHTIHTQINNPINPSATKPSNIVC